MQGLPDISDDQVFMDKGSTKRQNNEAIASAGAPESNDCAEFSDGKQSGLSAKGWWCTPTNTSVTPYALVLMMIVVEVLSSSLTHLLPRNTKHASLWPGCTTDDDKRDLCILLRDTLNKNSVVAAGGESNDPGPIYCC